MAVFIRLLAEIRYADTLAESIDDAESLLILTRWVLFNELPAMLTALEQQPLVIDARRMLDKDATERYDGIGYPV